MRKEIRALFIESGC